MFFFSRENFVWFIENWDEKYFPRLRKFQKPILNLKLCLVQEYHLLNPLNIINFSIHNWTNKGWKAALQLWGGGIQQVYYMNDEKWLKGFDPIQKLLFKHIHSFCFLLQALYKIIRSPKHKSRHSSSRVLSPKLDWLINLYRP